MNNEQQAPLLDPTGMIPMSPFMQNMGYQFPVYVSHQTWEDCGAKGPYAMIQSLLVAIDKALATERGDQGYIIFKHWIPPEPHQRKAKRIRLFAELYQTTETKDPWILMSLAPSKRGLLVA